MSETDLSRAIRQTLERLGVWCWRSQAGTARGGRTHLAPAGTPDILGILPGGRALGLEVKRPGEKATPEQRAWGERCRVMGGVFAVVTSAQEAVDVVRTATLPPAHGGRKGVRGPWHCGSWSAT